LHRWAPSISRDGWGRPLFKQGLALALARRTNSDFSKLWGGTRPPSPPPGLGGCRPPGLGRAPGPPDSPRIGGSPQTPCGGFGRRQPPNPGVSGGAGALPGLQGWSAGRQPPYPGGSGGAGASPRLGKSKIFPETSPRDAHGDDWSRPSGSALSGAAIGALHKNKNETQIWLYRIGLRPVALEARGFGCDRARLEPTLSFVTPESGLSRLRPVAFGATERGGGPLRASSLCPNFRIFVPIVVLKHQVPNREVSIHTCPSEWIPQSAKNTCNINTPTGSEGCKAAPPHASRQGTDGWQGGSVAMFSHSHLGRIAAVRIFDPGLLHPPQKKEGWQAHWPEGQLPTAT